MKVGSLYAIRHFDCLLLETTEYLFLAGKRVGCRAHKNDIVMALDTVTRANKIKLVLVYHAKSNTIGWLFDNELSEI